MLRGVRIIQVSISGTKGTSQNICKVLIFLETCNWVKPTEIFILCCVDSMFGE